MATKRELKKISQQAAKTRDKVKAEKDKKNAEEKLEKVKLLLTPAVDVIKEETTKEVSEEKELTLEEELEQLRELQEKILRREKRQKLTWDVKETDEFDHFDPTLSYEITGYRPINMTQGLDFDPTPFCEDGETYERTGKYITYPRGSKLYMDWWRERLKRCKEGYTVDNYTITGDHYYFLNFYRLPNVFNVKKAAEGRVESFPKFFAKQYEFFHYVKLAECLGKDVIALKARGVGFSEIGACLGVRPYITTRRARLLYTAASDTYLTGVLKKCWTQLEFVDLHTDGGFKRLRLKKNSETFKRASIVDSDGIEQGHMAEIEGIVADAPRKIRGDRCERLFFEEAGSNPALITSFNQAKALVELLGVRFGIRILWGTGGDTGPSIEGISKMYFNPVDYDILPYKHNYTDSGDTVLTGFFIPAYTMVNDYVDNRGVTNELLAKEYYEKERLKKASNSKNLMEYKSEYCFTAEEALLGEGDSRFDKEIITEQIANIEIHKNVPAPIQGDLIWQKDKDGNIDKSRPPFWRSDPRGKIFIVEQPMFNNNDQVTLPGTKLKEKQPYVNLYVAGIDSIDRGLQDSSGQKDVSDFCIVIKRRRIGLKDPKYVAIYKDRPKDIRTAYDTALKLLMWYNAKAVLESTHMSITTYFREQKKTQYLFKRPRATLPSNSNSNTKMYGTPATKDIIEHYLDLIESYIFDYCYHIDFIEVLKQLLKYSDENKRKFDIVAAMGMCELGDEELGSVSPIVKDNINKQWRDIGYYKDEDGIMRFGVIPSNKENYSLQQNGYRGY